MKILNKISRNLNWIEIKLYIESNFNSIPIISKWIPIQFLLNWIELNWIQPLD
jgi:hypothetical protein